VAATHLATSHNTRADAILATAYSGAEAVIATKKVIRTSD